MPCFKPLDAWQKAGGGKPAFSASAVYNKYIQLPCGQCSGCRLERARQWALRCMNEASCWDYNSFVLCTYSDDNLPANGSLVKKHHQDFIKRLRDRLDYPPMKFYMCGEYGDTYGRPHYHYLLFGIDFADKVFHQTTPSGYKLYTSALLDDIWGHGHCNIGSVTFDSACYTAKYIMKKTTGKGAIDAYNIYDPETGEVLSEIEPEFNCMSRSSGIGKEYFERFAADIYPRDLMVVNGVKCRPPRYYDIRYSIDDPLGLAWIKELRRREARVITPEELAAKEYVVGVRLSRSKMGMRHG